MKTTAPEEPDPSHSDWDSLPLIAEINSEDDKLRRAAEEKAFPILYRQGMAWMKAKTVCSQDEVEDAVLAACEKWFRHIRNL